MTFGGNKDEMEIHKWYFNPALTIKAEAGPQLLHERDAMVRSRATPTTIRYPGA